MARVALPWDTSAGPDKHGEAYVRPASDARYHSPRWTKLSKRWRDNHPLCERCRKRGVIRAATCVDHIVPVPMCDDFYDERNLQSLCDECNMLKGIEDRKLIQKWRSARGEGGKNL